PEEGVHLLEASLHGQGRGVGQVALHGAQDPLDRIVMWRVAAPYSKRTRAWSWAASQRSTAWLGAGQARRCPVEVRPSAAVLQPGHSLSVVAVDPAPNGAGVVLEECGDLGGGEAAQGEPDHDQAQSEAPGALKQGRDRELATGGRLG